MFDDWNWYDWFPGLESNESRMTRRMDSGRDALITYNEDAREIYDNTLDDPEWVNENSWFPPIKWWQDYRKAQEENRYWRDWYKNMGLDPSDNLYPWTHRRDIQVSSSPMFAVSNAIMSLYRGGRRKW